MYESIGLMVAAIVFTQLLLRVARTGNGSDNTARRAFVVLTVIVLGITALVLLAISAGIDPSNP